jgi:hypothetical protein
MNLPTSNNFMSVLSSFYKANLPGRKDRNDRIYKSCAYIISALFNVDKCKSSQTRVSRPAYNCKKLDTSLKLTLKPRYRLYYCALLDSIAMMIQSVWSYNNVEIFLLLQEEVDKFITRVSAVEAELVAR